MLVGLESMDVFTSRTMILSRKLLDLHLILWIQPIALNSNTIHNNVQRSGEEERRMEIARKSPQLDPHHVVQKTAYQNKKCVFTAECLKPCISSKTTVRKKKAGLDLQGACFPVRKPQLHLTDAYSETFYLCTDAFMLSG